LGSVFSSADAAAAGAGEEDLEKDGIQLFLTLASPVTVPDGVAGAEVVAGSDAVAGVGAGEEDLEKDGIQLFLTLASPVTVPDGVAGAAGVGAGSDAVVDVGAGEEDLLGKWKDENIDFLAGATVAALCVVVFAAFVFNCVIAISLDDSAIYII